MIAFLNGVLIYKQAPNIIINVNGVGYELLVPMSTYYNLPDLLQQVSLYSYQYVREDIIALYGFANLDERKLFIELLKANGVGPRMALTILSNYQVAEFISIIDSCNAGALVKLPGVGKKTADRLLLELRDRLKAVFANRSADSINNINNNSDHALGHGLDYALDTSVADAIAALETLGYKSMDAKRVVTKLASDNKNFNSENLIKAALREFR